MWNGIQSASSALARRDPVVALALFFAVASVCFGSAAGITSSNDGSHYALVRAISERGSFEIGDLAALAEFQDVAYHEDRRYSDRPPGTALLAAGLYSLGRAARVELAALAAEHDPGNPFLPHALLLSPLMAGGTAALFYLSLRRHFKRSQAGSLLATLALGFGSILWRYGAVLFSHATAAFFVWLALYLCFEVERGWLQPGGFALLGFAIGFSPVVEYSSNVFSALALGYLALSAGPVMIKALRDAGARRSVIIHLVAFGIGLALPIVFLLAYNWINFGDPLTLSSSKVDLVRWPENASFAARFSTPLGYGLRSVLIWGGNNQGLFLLSPVALIGLPGLVIGLREGMAGRYNHRLMMLLATFIFYQALFASLTYFNPYTNDGRYIATFLACWFVFVAYGIDAAIEQIRSGQPRWLLMLLIYGLIWMSIRNQFWHIAFSWGYGFEPAPIARLALQLDKVGEAFDRVFANRANLPLIWAWAFALGLATWAARNWIRPRGEDAR